MIHAYDEIYLEDAMRNLGEAIDYISSDCQKDIDEFFHLFISTGIAEEFGNGNPSYIAGMSGPELAMAVFEKAGYQGTFPCSSENTNKSPAYWCGWILAYYQWYTAMPFREISYYITLQEIETLYFTLHEAPEEKFVDILNMIIHQNPRPTKLQQFRRNRGLTQKELAATSGVSLRSIQMYEQRNKDINKAQAINVYRLAKILGCRIQDLFEY